MATVGPWSADPRTGERRALRFGFFSAVVLAGLCLTLLSLRPAIEFLASAPGQFWVLAAFAVVADLRPFRPPAPPRRSATFLVSICFCFGILLAYGTAPAVVVQILAVTVAAWRLRLDLRTWAFLSARLVCSMAAAGWVIEHIGPSTVEIAGPLRGPQVLAVMASAAVFLIISGGLNAIAARLSGASRSEIVTQLRLEVTVRGSLLLLAPVLVSTATGWTVALIAVPLIGWSRLTRTLEDQVRRLERDPVTGLLSRHGIADAVAALSRSEDRTPGAEARDWYVLVLIQLRGVGEISANLGRTMAEKVLAAAAERLRAKAAPGTRMGRLSENQFLVLRPDPLPGAAEVTAQALVAALTDPVDVGGLPFRLRPIAGAVVAPRHGTDLATLVAHAEAALYDATIKRTPFAVYEPAGASEVEERLALLADLRWALVDPSRSSEITVTYQPQVTLATGHVGSVEALFRWDRPGHGPVPTDELIAAVEQTAVMQVLTVHVLGRVVTQLAEWNAAGIHLRAAVNVSALDLSVAGFDELVRTTLLHSGVPPSQLVIEVTEGAIAEDSAAPDEAAHRLRATGVGLSLDDFGTGFASLSRLRRLPLSEVKIDRSYVSDIATDDAAWATVTTIHRLAGILGLRVVAEGIEDEPTAHRLAGLEGVVGQGWYFGRPMEAPALIDWLSSRLHR